jgi:hypothetical protein
MKDLDRILEKLYNKLGNNFLTKNFETGPFEFRVNVRKGKYDNDLKDYIVEVYSIPNMPDQFKYKGGPRDLMSGVHISIIKREFRNYINLVDPTFGGFGKTVGINFMNVK